MRTLLLAVMIALAGCDEAPRASARLNLDTATMAQLEALPAIGPVHARSIIASRNARGGHFHSIDDLLAIDGIGAKTVDAIRPFVMLP